jgi:hypothetical protein
MMKSSSPFWFEAVKHEKHLGGATTYGQQAKPSGSENPAQALYTACY